MSETKVLTTNEVADEIGTEPKTLRKFFRSNNCSIEPVGQGKRYGISADDVEELKAQFAAWAGGKAKKADEDDAEPKPDKAPKKTSSRKKKAPEPVAEEDDFDDDLSLDAVADPDDDDILSLDDEDLEV